MADLTGRTLGEYRLLQLIGQGGMASVYLAHEVGRGREVALKVLSPLIAENRSFLLRFRREARVVAGLKHPHIVPLEDFGEIDGYAYLAMPRYPGNLAARMTLSPLTPAEAGRLVSQVASALEYAHRRGVVHRDVKPSNILLDEKGNALLSDFGLAQIQDASVSLTGSALIGTPAYVSPEQVRGEPMDGRSDQYALGIVLFQIATGRLPFRAETPMALLVKQAHEPLPEPRRVNPNVPAAVEQVILTATAKRPEDRYPSMSEMARSFAEALSRPHAPGRYQVQTLRLKPSDPESQGGIGRRPAVRRRRRRWLAPVGIASGLLLLAMAGAAMQGFLASRSANDEPSASQVTGLQQTIAALSTSVAGAGGTLSPDQISTLVAGTLTGPAGRETSPASTSTAPTASPSTNLPTQTPTLPATATGAASTATSSPAPTGTPTATTSPSPTAAPTPTPPPTATPLLPLPTLPILSGVIRLSGRRGRRRDPLTNGSPAAAPFPAPRLGDSSRSRPASREGPKWQG